MIGQSGLILANLQAIAGGDKTWANLQTNPVVSSSANRHQQQQYQS
jgi:hypothetical protein